MIFTEGELRYLADQRLGRLATVRADGTVQNNPVAFAYHPPTQGIDIGGHAMATSRKYRNVGETGRVAFVVDDIVSERPWLVRCLEIRGVAEAIDDPDETTARFPGAIIRIRPTRVISWGLDPEGHGRGARDVG